MLLYLAFPQLRHKYGIALPTLSFTLAPQCFVVIVISDIGVLSARMYRYVPRPNVAHYCEVWEC